MKLHYSIFPFALLGSRIQNTYFGTYFTVFCNNSPSCPVTLPTGEVLSYRVFPSILGPVTALDIHTANEIIAGVGVQSVSSAAALESAGHGDVVDSAAHREHGQGQPIRDRKSSGGLTSGNEIGAQLFTSNLY